MGPTFEWNAKKARRNLRKHGVSFEEAKSVFLDPLSITVADPAQTVTEDRFVDIGTSVQGRVLVVVYTERGSNIRLISCRRQHQWKHELMNKDISKEMTIEDDDMLPEYDFTGGVRGKHYQAMRKGYTVKIDQADGTTLIQHFKLEEGTALLDPDVRKYFPDSEAVNTALRCLIPLVAHQRDAATKS